MTFTSPHPFTMMGGQDIGLLPTLPELTVAQAAELLLVSESFMLTLLDSGEISCQNIGNQRYIKSVDLFAFKAKQKRLHLETVDELVEEGQLLNPNY